MSDNSRKEQWMAIFADHEKSNLSVAKYCKLNGIDYREYRAASDKYRGHCYIAERNEQRRVRVFEEYKKSGKSLRCFCIDNGESYSSLYKFAQKHGYNLNTERKRSATEWDDIVSDYIRSGISARKYCANNNINYRVFVSTCNEKYFLSPRSFVSQLDFWEEMRKEWKESGLKQKEFCESMGLNYGTFITMGFRLKRRNNVYNILRSVGITDVEIAVDSILKLSTKKEREAGKCRYVLAERYINEWLCKEGY